MKPTNFRANFSIKQLKFFYSQSSQASMDLNIQWFTLDENGVIKTSNESLQNKAAIYIYQSILDEDKIYVGSTYNLIERFHRHRRAFNGGYNSCPIFYNSIRKYGWDNFRFGILEYINLELHPGADNSENGTKIKKEIILKREQYYLDLLLPSLNVNKIAGSMLGFKFSEKSKKLISEGQKGEKNYMFGKTHSEETKEIMSLVKRGEKNNMFGKTRSEEFKLKLSQDMGTKIYLYSLDNTLIQTIPSVMKAVKELKASHITIMKYAKSHDIFRNKFILSLEPLKSDFKPPVEKVGTTIFLFTPDGIFLDSFPTLNEAANHFECGISTVWRYARSGKVFKEKYILSLEKSSSICEC